MVIVEGVFEWWGREAHVCVDWGVMFHISCHTSSIIGSPHRYLPRISSMVITNFNRTSPGLSKFRREWSHPGWSANHLMNFIFIFSNSYSTGAWIFQANIVKFTNVQSLAENRKVRGTEQKFYLYSGIAKRHIGFKDIISSDFVRCFTIRSPWPVLNHA